MTERYTPQQFRLMAASVDPNCGKKLKTLHAMLNQAAAEAARLPLLERAILAYENEHATMACFESVPTEANRKLYIEAQAERRLAMEALR